MGGTDGRIGKFAQQTPMHRSLLVAVPIRVYLKLDDSQRFADLDKTKTQESGDCRRVTHLRCFTRRDTAVEQMPQEAENRQNVSLHAIAARTGH